MQEYRCTRNAPYAHVCIGYDDLTVRQGYYIHAHSREDAWHQMAVRFPEETKLGFTVEPWQSSGFNSVIRRVERDENGEFIL